MTQNGLDPEPRARARRARTHSGDGGGRAPAASQLVDGSSNGPLAYDVTEVMRRLGVTRPTLYRFLRSGELRSFRLGARRLVSAVALEDFIRERESVEAG